MHRVRTVADWMQLREVTFDQLVEASRLSTQVVVAILEHRYTPSQQQRQSVAEALSVEVELIAWGHANVVE